MEGFKAILQNLTDKRLLLAALRDADRLPRSGEKAGEGDYTEADRDNDLGQAEACGVPR